MDDKLRKMADQGRRAETLMSDETLVNCLKAIEIDIIEGFRTCRREEAENYWAVLQAHDEFIRRLALAAANGRDAERDIEQRNEDARRERTNKSIN